MNAQEFELCMHECKRVRTLGTLRKEGAEGSNFRNSGGKEFMEFDRNLVLQGKGINTDGILSVLVSFLVVTFAFQSDTP
jgi:hypothetical protein